MLVMIGMLILGAGIGLVWTPEPGMTMAESVAYFTWAGACAVPLVSVVRQLAEKRGYKITLPGDTVLPPDPDQRLPKDPKVPREFDPRD
jgi:hypothetical protein